MFVCELLHIIGAPATLKNKSLQESLEYVVWASECTPPDRPDGGPSASSFSQFVVMYFSISFKKAVYIERGPDIFQTTPRTHDANTVFFLIATGYMGGILDAIVKAQPIPYIAGLVHRSEVIERMVAIGGLVRMVVFFHTHSPGTTRKTPLSTPHIQMVSLCVGRFSQASGSVCRWMVERTTHTCTTNGYDIAGLNTRGRGR
ncbi:hypothetical protein V8E53_005852 [Lactarius tabidus]